MKPRFTRSTFCSQVASDVLQHCGPRLWTIGEMPLQRSNLPTHRDHDFKKSSASRGNTAGEAVTERTAVPYDALAYSE